SIPMMSSEFPTNSFLFFSLSSLETGLSGTIFKTLPLRMTSTGTPVLIASSRIRKTFSRSFVAVTRMLSSRFHHIIRTLRQTRTYDRYSPAQAHQRDRVARQREPNLHF